MIKTLVAIEVDLASSLAIRYACQLGNLIHMELHPVYVKEPPPEVPATGTGWVRHTWEREIVELGKEEIQEMLAAEMESCPQLHEPRVIYGDREYELLKIVDHEPFDLYVEGPLTLSPRSISSGGCTPSSISGSPRRSSGSGCCGRSARCWCPVSTRRAPGPPSSPCKKSGPAVPCPCTSAWPPGPATR